MSGELTIDPRLANVGNQKPVKGADLANATLNAGNEVTVYSTQVPADKVLFWGYGSNDRQRGRMAYIYAELLANGSGSGADGDALTGDLVAVITDSEQQDVLARYEVGDLDTLADAQADKRTQRPVFPALSPFATEDKHLELRVRADSASDGKVVANDSNVRLYHSKASV